MYHFNLIFITLIFISSDKLCESYTLKHKDLSYYRPAILSPNNELFTKSMNISKIKDLKFYFFHTSTDKVMNFLRSRSINRKLEMEELEPYSIIKETEANLNFSDDGNLVTIKYVNYFSDKDEIIENIEGTLKDYDVERQVIDFFDKLLSKNESYSKTIPTGKNSLKKIGIEIRNINVSFDENCWNDLYCDKIDRIEIDSFRLTNNNNELTYYSDYVLRPLKMIYKKDVEFKGIKVRRYEFDESNYDMTLKENECYCIDKSKTINGKSICDLKGILDISECNQNEYIVSHPHFLNASPEVFSHLKVLKPNVTEHTSFLDFDPVAQIIVRYNFSFQFNTHSEPIDIIIPQYYVTETSVINNEEEALFYEIID